MDEWLRGFVFKKRKLGGVSFSFLDVLLALCITGTGIMLRIAVVHYTVTDALKIGAMVLDFFLAVLGGALVYSYTGGRNRAFLTYSILAIYPTAVANSALWGRNSVLYVWFLILGLYLYVKQHKWPALFSTLLGLILAGSRMRISTQSLSLGWPNFYEIVGKGMFVELYNQAAVLCLLGFLLTMFYWLVKKQAAVTKDLALSLFLFLAILIPYFAPSMPAWAGYTADVAALLYAMRRPGKFYIPMLHLIVSYSAYANVINGETKLPMAFYSVILLVLLADVGAGMFREVSEEKITGGDKK